MSIYVLSLVIRSVCNLLSCFRIRIHLNTCIFMDLLLAVKILMIGIYSVILSTPEACGQNLNGQQNPLFLLIAQWTVKI